MSKMIRIKVNSHGLKRNSSNRSLARDSTAISYAIHFNNPKLNLFPNYVPPPVFPGNGKHQPLNYKPGHHLDSTFFPSRCIQPKFPQVLLLKSAIIQPLLQRKSPQSFSWTDSVGFLISLSTLSILPFHPCLLLLLLSRFSHVRLCATPETAAHQAPPSLGFSRQEHWSGLPFLSPMHESEK